VLPSAPLISLVYAPGIARTPPSSADDSNPSNLVSTANTLADARPGGACEASEGKERVVWSATVRIASSVGVAVVLASCNSGAAMLSGDWEVKAASAWIGAVGLVVASSVASSG
jgi:hypothetical protein